MSARYCKPTSVTLNTADIIFLSRANNKELDEYVNKEICKKI